MVDGVTTLPEVTVYGTIDYGSMDAAALDALEYILPISLDEGVEYSGLLIKLPNGRFNYVDPVTEHSANSSPFDMKPPVGRTVVGFYHTHPLTGNNWQNFSLEDMMIARSTKKVLYLGNNIAMKKLTPPALLSGADAQKYPLLGKPETLRSYSPIKR